jgi:hypothetical protein
MSSIRCPACVEMTLDRMAVSGEDMWFENEDGTIGFIMTVEKNVDTDVYDVNIEYDMTYQDVVDIAHRQSMHPDVSLRARHMIGGKSHTSHVEDIGKLVHDLNTCLDMKICFCNQAFICDAYDMCLLCNMKAEESDLELVFCPICQEKGPKLAMSVWGCCGAPSHKTCRRKWEENDSSKGCPMCRQK